MQKANSTTKHSSKLILKLLTSIFILLMPIWGYTQSNSYSTTDWINLRTGPGTKFTSLRLIPKGDTVKVLKKTNINWYEVRYKDKTGFCSSKFLISLENNNQKKEAPEDSSNFWTGFILFAIFGAFFFSFIGIVNRNKTLAKALAFTTGGLGFHKFYLGQYLYGILALFFAWTFIPIILGIIDFVRIENTSLEEFNEKYNPQKDTKRINKDKPQQSKKDSSYPSHGGTKSGRYGFEINHSYGYNLSNMKSNNEIKQRDERARQYLSSNEDNEILDLCQSRYPFDLELQEIMFKEQYSSKKYLKKASHTDVKSTASILFPYDYKLQQEYYDIQVSAKEYIENTKDIELRKHVKLEFPDDYKKQKELYKELLSLKESSLESPEENTESIIDINQLNLDKEIEIDSHNSINVPPWFNVYVFSYEEIKNANKAQKQFYHFLKTKVINGEYVDIKNNTNYAFILYFDLLNDFKKHNNVKRLNQEFKLLGKICSKTKTYTLRSLRDITQRRRDKYSKELSSKLEDPTFRYEEGYEEDHYENYRFGNKYKEKLNLSKIEIKWLNKFHYFPNSFTEIEFCLKSVIKYFILILHDLDKELKEDNSSVEKEVRKLSKVSREQSIYVTIFNRIENYIRVNYGFRRKAKAKLYSRDNKTNDFENNLWLKIEPLLEKNKKNIQEPPDELQIFLNKQYNNRWKKYFKEACNLFSKENIEDYKKTIRWLEKTNIKNPDIENILYESSKFIAIYDRKLALNHYLKYIYYDIKSEVFDNKKLNKRIESSLFKSMDEKDNFREIVAELIESGNIEVAIQKLEFLSNPRRKKIKLDKSKISSIENSYKGTVELLDKYLGTEEDSSTSTDNNTPLSQEESIEVHPGLKINKVQTETLDIIVQNSFSVKQSIVEEIAIRNNLLKNQLIDSINELFEDSLDGEPLIEEEEDKYVIEESYYNEIKQ